MPARDSSGRFVSGGSGGIVVSGLRESGIIADVMPKLEEKAGRIVAAANRNTSAPVGIIYEVEEDHILLGPTGAAGLPVEIGHQGVPANRYFKAALDADSDQ